MSDGFTDYLATLDKGQKIHLACKGDGMLIGSAILRDCQPIESWAEKQAINYVKTMTDKIPSDNQSRDLMTILCVTVALTPLIDSSSSCFSGQYNENCASDLEAAIKHIGKEQIKEAGKKIGLDSTRLAISLRG